jgi:putative solute:sodium symporter small subunit
MTEEVPPRVVVAHPMTRTSRGRAGKSHVDVRSASGIDQADAELALRSIMSAQGRITLRWFNLLALLLLGTLATLKWVPQLTDTRVVGVPLSWVILGAGMYPCFVVMAARYVRRTEAVEERFAQLTSSFRSTDRSSDG